MAIIRWIVSFTVAFVAMEAWGEDAAVTIVGAGSGPIHVVGKDGSVEELSNKDLKLQYEPGVNPTAAKPLPTAKADDHAGLPIVTVKPVEKPKPGPIPQVDAEAKAKAAAEKAKKDKQKELAHYQDKDYTYGPGTADLTDKTSVVLKKKGVGRPAPKVKDSAAKDPVSVKVGGETRIRASSYK